MLQHIRKRSISYFLARISETVDYGVVYHLFLKCLIVPLLSSTLQNHLFWTRFSGFFVKLEFGFCFATFCEMRKLGVIWGGFPNLRVWSPFS